MGKITVLPETTLNPISLIGARAGVCWGGDITDAEKNYQRGLDCIESGHGRTFEYVNVELVLDGYSARVIREWYTHLGGAPTRLQASTRYINYKDFSFVTPPKIAKNPKAKKIYEETMRYIATQAAKLESIGVPREDAAMVLPLGMGTRVVDKRNLRSLIDMSRQRMCIRAYHEYRQLFNDILEALSQLSAEWEYVVRTQMMPKCEYLGFCPEKKTCGHYDRLCRLGGNKPIIKERS